MKLGEIYSSERDYHDKQALLEADGFDITQRYEIFTRSNALRIMGDIKGKQILDIGCGIGRESAWLSSHGADVVGMDLSPGMIDVAIQHSPAIDFRVGNIEALDFHDDFDIVFCQAALHHLPRVEMAIGRIYEALKPDGLFLCQEPMADNPVAVFARRFVFEPTPTEHPFKRKELETMISRVFGNVLSEHYYIFAASYYGWRKLGFLRFADIYFDAMSRIDASLLSFDLMKKFAWIVQAWAIKPTDLAKEERSVFLRQTMQSHFSYL